VTADNPQALSLLVEPVKASRDPQLTACGTGLRFAVMVGVKSVLLKTRYAPLGSGQTSLHKRPENSPSDSLK
jgi:hypothetical protein